MEIKGQISEIIYQNEVNSYTVAEFETEDELTTIVGYLPFINKGDSLKLVGNFVNHPEYGEQFKIQTFEKILPETEEALENYLAGGIIKGVGPATAKRIVDKFKDETIAVLKFEPDRLALVKGISLAKAQEISEEFNEKWDLWQIVGFLEKFGISPQSSKKVYEKLGQNAVEKIRENPYILINITNAVDFKKIDKMALDLGISIDNSDRIASGIKYSLILAGSNGNTCVIYENLVSFVSDLLDIGKDPIKEVIINLKAKEEIYLEEREDGKWVYLNNFYIAEKNIAEKIMALQNAKNIKEIKKFDKELQKAEAKEEIILSEEQKEAIKTVHDNNVCIITGGPGTGKTTIIRTIINIYEAKKYKVVLCAPTGRAAKRMQEQTGKEAVTIHRLLEIKKLEDENYIDIDYPITPIDADIVIIDEMSMVDTFLMNHILKATYLGTKIILVGDINQLPAVGPGTVLEDIINSEKISTIKLNKIFRQAAKSKIITNAHKVNNGESFIGAKEEKGKLDDFFFINEPTMDKALQDVISLCTGRLEKYGDFDFFKNIQVLTPTKKGMLGTKELNKVLQNALNPKTENTEKQSGDRVFRIGDRVMQIKNNYDIYWERENENKIEYGTGIFNGELGRVTKVDENERVLEVVFDDDKSAWYEFSNLDELEHSYSITIHKSQRK